MLVSYPAIFYYDSVDGGYIVNFPDIENSVTQGDNINEAMYMASEYLGMYISELLENGEELPKVSHINNISLEKDFLFNDDEDMKKVYINEKSYKTMIITDVESYLKNRELIRKTVNIPKWVNDLGQRKKINFSKCLTDSIINSVLK